MSLVVNKELGAECLRLGKSWRIEMKTNTLLVLVVLSVFDNSKNNFGL